MENTKMTTRDYLTVIANGKTSEDVQAWAKTQIEKLDARNAARAAKPSKTAIENAPLKEAIVTYLTENEGKFTEPMLGDALGMSHNKAGSLVRQLVAEGKVSAEEAKIPKVGKRKVYFIAR